MDPVVHFEIPADNLARAQKFYKSIFGWKIKKYPMEGMEYYALHTVAVGKDFMPKTKGAINGGMMKRPHKGQGPVIAISVKSIGATLKKMASMGGKVLVKPMKIEDMGYYAYAADSEGNIIGIWQDIK